MRKGNTAWKIIFLLLTVLWTFQIFRRSGMTSELSHMESLSVLELVRRIFSGVTMHFIRKAAHFAEFFLLGIISWAAVFSFYKSSFLIPGAYCLLIACLDEGLQCMIPGRSGEVGDVVLDFSGSFLAILIAVLTAVVLKRRSQGGTPNGGEQNTGKKV